MQKVTFDVYTTATPYPWVTVDCYDAKGASVYHASNGIFPTSLQQVFTLALEHLDERRRRLHGSAPELGQLREARLDHQPRVNELPRLRLSFPADDAEAPAVLGPAVGLCPS